MIRIHLLGALAAVSIVGACGDDESKTDTSPDTTPDTSPDTTPDTSPDTAPDTSPDTAPDTSPDVEPDTADTTPDGDVGPTFPTPPALGTAIDRIGRPAVATALIAPFEADAAAKGSRKDAYNAAASDAWQGFAAEMSASLAIYDGLDTVCGNQLAAGGTATAGRYATLGAVLADDRLWVNTASTTCSTYLAVEADATGILANADCGGRAPGYDVIDATYSVVAVGAFGGVTDGIAADDGTPSATFPFLDAPGPEGFPSPPGLSTTQIDRIGRPAVGTALIAAFEADATAKGDAKDDYNAAAPDAWLDFAPEMAKNLAIYDALDTVCGNQLAAGPNADAGRYDTLASVLTLDSLWVNTAATTCTTYLAVEANATGILPNSDCGGRQPGYDVIDVTYSAVAIGALSGVSDGIAIDDATVSAEFPFLAPAE